MNWSDVKSAIGTAAPLVGSLLGPAGTAVGSLVASALGVEDSPDAVHAALKTDPKALAKIRALEIEQQTELRRLALQAEQNRMAADTQRIQAVNATMQAEAQSEHWPQWAWRPFNGFVFGITLFCNYAVPALINSLVIPWFGSGAAQVEAGHIPEFVFVAWGAVLGVSAWHRGQSKRIKAGETSG